MNKNGIIFLLIFFLVCASYGYSIDKKNVTVVKNNRLLTLSIRKSWSIDIDFQILSTLNIIDASILHITTGSRTAYLPAVFLVVNTTKLKICNYANKIYKNCITTKAVGLKTKTNLYIEQRLINNVYYYQVFINNEFVLSTPNDTPNVPNGASNRLVYTSNPWNGAANMIIDNFKIRVDEESLDDISLRSSSLFAVPMESSVHGSNNIVIALAITLAVVLFFFAMFVIYMCFKGHIFSRKPASFPDINPKTCQSNTGKSKKQDSNPYYVVDKDINKPRNIPVMNSLGTPIPKRGASLEKDKMENDDSYLTFDHTNGAHAVGYSTQEPTYSYTESVYQGLSY